MDQHRVSTLSRSLSSISSRRDVLRGLVAVGLGLGMARVPAAEAKKKGKKKRKKKAKTPQSRPNQYGCLSVGAACKNADQCCSGICDNNANCGCFRTTADSVYRNAGLFLENGGDPRCADCKKDADCLALGYPPESACAAVSPGLCAGVCPTGMACLTPCGTELPDPQMP